MNEAAAVARIRAMLDRRGPGKTLCPSEVARTLAIAGKDWRAAMPQVHAGVDVLLARGAIRIGWRGQVLTERSGPYRIGKGP